jgi:RimJ/RimL family protein N-acetyltransferase
MSAAPSDDRGFREPIALRDGTPAVIRAMRPDDRERLVAAFAKLDRGTIYTRFFSFRKELPERALDRIAEVDFDALGALVATVGSGAEETVIGSSTYVVRIASDGARVAEVAFTIEEDYQGQGLARRLLAAMAAIARRHGVTRFEAVVLAENAPMLAVFRRSGLPLHQRRESGEIHLELDLAEQSTTG